MKFKIVKKIFLAFIFPAIIFETIHAQIFYMGGGENFSFINIESLDFVVNRYNETRTYLTKEMDDFSYMRGGTVNLGFVGESGLTLEMAWVGRHMKQYAEGVDNTNTLQRRDLKIRNNTFNIGGGYTFARESVFCPGILATFDFGSFRSFTRIAPADDIKDADFDQISKDTQLGLSFMLNLMIAAKEKPWGIAIRPYYQVQLFGVDYQELNFAINPATASADYTEDLSEPNSNFGVQVTLMLVFRDK